MRHSRLRYMTSHRTQNHVEHSHHSQNHTRCVGSPRWRLCQQYLFRVTTFATAWRGKNFDVDTHVSAPVVGWIQLLLKAESSRKWLNTCKYKTCSSYRFKCSQRCTVFVKRFAPKRNSVKLLSMTRPTGIYNKYFSWFLICLIALQSLSVAADIHQFHQSGQEHLEFSHEQSAASISEKQDAQNQSAELLDCQHCCHCHGSTHFFPGGMVPGLGIKQSQQIKSEYTFINLSRYSPPDLRPPIA